jgi:hypothetical protein
LIKKTKIFAILLVPFFWFSACKEELNEIDYNPNVLSSKDYLRGEDAVLEIFNAFFKGINDTAVINHGYGYIDACDVTLYDDENLMTFGYGPFDRICQDGKFRRGLFSVEFSGTIFAEGVTAHLETDSLFVDDLLVIAIIDITNNGMNQDNKPAYSFKVISANVMLPDTNTVRVVNLTTDFIFSWEQGSSTPTVHEDDIFFNAGTSAGVSSDGYAFSVEIIEPLENYVDCFWISRGMSRITVPAAKIPSGEIDYIDNDGCFNEIHFIFNENLFFDFLK